MLPNHFPSYFLSKVISTDLWFIWDRISMCSTGWPRTHFLSGWPWIYSDPCLFLRSAGQIFFHMQKLSWPGSILLNTLFSHSQPWYQSQISFDYNMCKVLLAYMVCWSIFWPYGNTTVIWSLWFFGLNFEINFFLLSENYFGYLWSLKFYINMRNGLFLPGKTNQTKKPADIMTGCTVIWTFVWGMP